MKAKSFITSLCVLCLASIIGYYVIDFFDNAHTKWLTKSENMAKLDRKIDLAIEANEKELAKFRIKEEQKIREEQRQQMLASPYFCVKGVALANFWDTTLQGTSALIVTLKDSTNTQILVKSYISVGDSIKYKKSTWGELLYVIKKKK